MIGPERVVADHMRERRRTGIIWLAVALVLAMTLGTAYRIDHRADATDEKLGASNKQVDTLTGQVEVNGQIARSAKDAADEANRRLAAAGKPTVPVPTVTPVGPASPSPATLTVDEVRALVALELSHQKITITQAEISQIARIAAQLVPKPADGKTPTAAQIQPIVTATLAAYCTGDKCVGRVGPMGPRGEKGDPAPKVTDEELLKAAQQALAAYCGQDGAPCDGRDGTNGQDGADAPVMVDMDCVGDGGDSYWRMQFNKGPDKTAMGPCRIGPEPPH